MLILWILIVWFFTGFVGSITFMYVTKFFDFDPIEDEKLWNLTRADVFKISIGTIFGSITFVIALLLCPMILFGSNGPLEDEWNEFWSKRVL